MANSEVEEFVSSLSDTDVHDLLTNLMKKNRNNMLEESLRYLDLVWSSLRVAQEHELADKIRVIMTQIRSKVK